MGGELGGLMESLILSLNDFPNGNSASNSVTEVNRRQVPSTAAFIYRLLNEGEKKCFSCSQPNTVNEDIVKKKVKPKSEHTS